MTAPVAGRAPSTPAGWAARRSYGPVGDRLPAFPWDSLAAARARAAAHPGGLVDLSVGTPVDPTPTVVRDALTRAADAPGYPTTHGTAALRAAVTGWLARRCGVPSMDPEAVLPTIGSKELVASLALQLGLGPDDTVVIPELAYPTYEVGARLASARVVVSDSPEQLEATPTLVWVNSPANPSGRVLSAERLAVLVSWARAHGVLLVSDECYLECGWEGEPPVSVLHPSVSGDRPRGVLAVHSLSKRSNLAGYRCAFVAGDPVVVAELLAVRKNLGLILPGPQQAAMVAALADDAHVEVQRERYAARRIALRAALLGAGLRVDHSEAALYLWARRSVGEQDQPCAEIVDWFAERGILVAPGDFYGAAGDRHVRIAVTATDERVAAAVARLT